MSWRVPSASPTVWPCYTRDRSSPWTPRIRSGEHPPRIRQFLDRVPDPIAKARPFRTGFENWRGWQEGKNENGSQSRRIRFGLRGDIPGNCLSCEQRADQGRTPPYRTYLRYAGGLEPGADVLFGGIKVGA